MAVKRWIILWTAILELWVSNRLNGIIKITKNPFKSNIYSLGWFLAGAALFTFSRKRVSSPASVPRATSVRFSMALAQNPVSRKMRTSTWVNQSSKIYFTLVKVDSRRRSCLIWNRGRFLRLDFWPVRHRKDSARRERLSNCWNTLPCVRHARHILAALSWRDHNWHVRNHGFSLSSSKSEIDLTRYLVIFEKLSLVTNMQIGNLWKGFALFKQSVFLEFIISQTVTAKRWRKASFSGYFFKWGLRLFIMDGVKLFKSRIPRSLLFFVRLNRLQRLSTRWKALLRRSPPNRSFHFHQINRID